MDKTYDIAIWGATGFVGKLISRYFAKNYDVDHIKVAIVARNKERLEEVKRNMIQINSKYQDVGVLVAEVHDQNSVDQAIKLAKVVINTVGPYTLYGQPVIDACVRFGTHYVDLTGESNWIKKMIQTYHEQAAEKGVIIVPSCGFDSIPSDLGSFMAAEALKKRYNEDAVLVKHTVMDIKGGVSGGTIASMMVVLDHASKEDLTNTHLLDPTPAEEDLIKRDKEAILPHYDPDLKTWTHMFVMASANTRIVRRSAGYLQSEDAGYAKDIKYIENQATPTLVRGVLATVLFVSIVLVFMIRPVRKLIERFLPKSGSGPSEETMRNGHYHGKFVAKSASGKSVTMDFKIKGDPGYSQTATMISESALCLLENRDQLPFTKLTKGGVLTPATAFGFVLADRLRKAGNFEIREDTGTTNQA
eukprot:TRINITY_DN10971_c0_g1_i1.p1 TRINITY_DN10971_c0_g1~~TRINITY_DN10971_c0_g1_i1.p1  ORF type:complete len:417 (+),score=94.67 TRINITY_DN10971_c0_g1_i1:134-1384(+)